MTFDSLKTLASDLPQSERMPVLFVGHGSPMNALEDNIFSRGWKTLGASLPKPNAVLCISAHWLTHEETLVHVGEKPETIHDFWGFPQELYDIRYPAPGSPEHARETKRAIISTVVKEDTKWGLDHGVWVVLHHLFPLAHIPVFQLSIDFSKHADFHYALGKEISALRNKGVLIIGSGNIVHNLGKVSFEENAPIFDWAEEFDARAKKLLQDGNDEALMQYQKLGASAELAIPMPDHYWPLIYTLGARDRKDTLSFPIEGIAHGSISMRSVLWN